MDMHDNIWVIEDLEQKTDHKLDKFGAPKATKASDVEFGEKFERLFNLMENTSKSLFITGKAGTGKSTLLRYFLKKTKKEVVSLAPTGLAAINADGQTIHRFFGFPPSMLDKSTIKRPKNPKMYERLDTLIIDEISMVRADLMDAMNLFLKKSRKSTEPFGGVQMILFGDLFQLPPVTKNEEKVMMNSRYSSSYFFDANIMKDFDIQIIELTEVFRQKEAEFIALLDSVRHGNISLEEISKINCRVDPVFLPKKDDPHIILCSTNYGADLINQQRLRELSGREFSYLAKLEGKCNPRSFPGEEKLILKSKARVIFIKNDPDGIFVNGSLGIVDELGHDYILVKLDDGTYVNLSQSTWEANKYEFDESKNEISSRIIGKITQFPIKLAWALTIHKSQGQTFENVFIDFSSGIWDHGQAYVALSRCTTLKGMVLKTPVLQKHVIVDPRVIQFMKW